MRKFVRYAGSIWLGLLTALVIGCGGTDTDGGAAASRTGGDNSGAEKRIVLLNNGPSPFWDAARAGMDKAATDLNLSGAGLRAVFEDNDGTPAGQLDKLRQFASQPDIVAIAISATDANNAAIADQLKNLQQKGVKVVTFDSDLDRDHFRDARTAFVGTNNKVGGQELGKCAKGLRPQGGGYITFVGRTGAQNAIERITGFAEGAGPKFKELDKMADEIDRTKARQNVRDAITNHPDDLKVLVGIWSYNAPAIVDVVKEKDKRKAYTIVTFDAEPLAVKDMADGMIDAMVVQNPFEMGYQSTRLLKALVQNDQATVHKILPQLGQPDGDIYDTGLKVVVPDHGSPLKKELFQKTTQFLTLGQFRDWLNQYKLTGS